MVFEPFSLHKGTCSMPITLALFILVSPTECPVMESPVMESPVMESPSSGSVALLSPGKCACIVNSILKVLKFARFPDFYVF